MGKALFLVILIGAGIGFAMPGSRSAPARAAVEAKETVLEASGNGHFYTHAQVNGELVRFLVDTGATDVALTTADAERLGIPFSPDQFEVVARGASGDVRGQRITIDKISVDGKEVTGIHGFVAEGLDISLLGQTYLSQISGVEMSRGTMILR
ncbi:MAG: TIGR02281 family clan AA aspartic protease [Alphaproteobacteria bacterium]|nr:MAG: TIGR02281 family clan AA aspartic protease [Alphaproteobacteria bacterium]